jgi:hypothetical protein
MLHKRTGYLYWPGSAIPKKRVGLRSGLHDECPIPLEMRKIREVFLSQGVYNSNIYE